MAKLSTDITASSQETSSFEKHRWWSSYVWRKTIFISSDIWKINEDLVKFEALKARGGSAALGLNADGWRRILDCNSYGTVNMDLRKYFAKTIKKIWIKKIKIYTETTKASQEAFLAFRPIPLDQNSCLRPIEIGEVLWKIAGKFVMQIVKQDVIKVTGCSKVCTGKEAGSKAAINVVHKTFDEKKKSRVIPYIDAENAFHTTSRKVIAHKNKYLCPELAAFVYCCFVIPTELFIISGKKIR